MGFFFDYIYVAINIFMKEKVISLFRFLKSHKWWLHWSFLSVLLLLFVFVAFFFQDQDWVSNVLQTIGTVVGFYLTIIIFLYSKEDSDKQFREHLAHLNKINNEQIQALHNSTEKQIDTLHKLTNDQISAFEKQINDVTSKLSDNSILLAEILGRELEKSLDFYSNALNKEKREYEDLSKWKLLRTDEERQIQLKNKWARIQGIQKGVDSIVSKYNSLRGFLGLGKN